jgi:hypothetical protein
MLVKLIWRVKGAVHYSKRGKCGRCVCRYVKCSYVFLLYKSNAFLLRDIKQYLKNCKSDLFFPKLEKLRHIPAVLPKKLALPHFLSDWAGLHNASAHSCSDSRNVTETSAVQVTVHPLIPRIGHNRNQCYEGSSLLFFILMIECATYIECQCRVIKWGRSSSRKGSTQLVSTKSLYIVLVNTRI